LAPRPIQRAKHIYTKIRRDIMTANPVRLFRYVRTVGRIWRVSRGEFFVPRPGGEDWRLYGDLQNVAHLLRYAWAEAALRPRKPERVLDIACGAGYGSYRLAGFAAEVVSVDANPGAVAYAEKHYSHPSIRHLVSKLEELPELLGDTKFDAIVSFDTIEHADSKAWLNIFAGLLQPDGALLLSTPIVPVTNHRPENPHHTIEYSAKDLREVLLTRFESIQDATSMPGAEVFTAASEANSGHRFHAEMSPCFCETVRPA
jgi:2-polyprenyl-3-methyl-5-hydroxy-6-metoxy-1,4-benzoquinol methylase